MDRCSSSGAFAVRAQKELQERRSRELPGARKVLGKSWFTACFSNDLCGSGSKTRLTKAAEMWSHLVRWGIRGIPQVRAEMWERSTFRSPKACSTLGLEHFWKLKNNCLVGAKHIWKPKKLKTKHARTTSGGCDVEKVHPVLARSTFSRCFGGTSDEFSTLKRHFFLHAQWILHLDR